MERTGWCFIFLPSIYEVEKLNTSILQKKWKNNYADAERNETDGQPKGLVSYLLFRDACCL